MKINPRSATPDSMRRQCWPLNVFAGIILAFLCLVPTAWATDYYFDVNGSTSGFGDPSGTYAVVGDGLVNATDTALWNTASDGTGTPGVFSSGDNALIFGSTSSDFAGDTFELDVNTGGSSSTKFGGITINSGSANVTIGGNDNFFVGYSSTWTVASGSTLIEANTRHGGLNWNKKSVVFNGGGIINFETVMGAGGSGNTYTITENMTNGTVNLQQTSDVSGQSGFTGSFTLQNGTLNFATPEAAAQVFDALVSGSLISINGGTIDNTSGSAQTLVTAAGTYSIGGDFTFAGSSDLGFGNAAVALAATSAITVSSNTLTIDGNINDGGSGYGLTKAGEGVLALNGTNSYSGGTVVNGGALVFGAAGSFPTNAASVTVNAGATLDISDAAPVALAASQTLSVSDAALTVGYSSLAAAITTPTLAVGGTTNIINVAALPVGVTFPLQIPVISYTALTGTFNFGLGAMPGADYTAYLSNNVANSSVDLVVVSGPVIRELTWSGAVNDNWNTQSADWIYNSAPTTYNQNDYVQFDDSAAGQTSISLATVLTPGGLTVSNDTHIYNLGNGNSGGGYISGPVGLAKDGTGLLILDDGGNNFSGGVAISAGTVQVGNNDGLGYLGTGPVVNNGALVFNRSANDASLTNNISGAGTMIQEGGDTLQLAGANTFTGNVLVTNNSTLQLGNVGALGGAPAVTIAGGSTLELNGFGLGTSAVTVQGGGGGNGAIINSGAEQDDALQFVTLTGDTTLGGSGRWDIRSGTGGATLSTGGNAYNLTKTGANQVSLVSVTVDPALGNVDVQQGALGFQSNTTGLGNPADTLTLESGATLEFYNSTNRLNKVVVLNGGGGYSIVNDSGANVIMGPVALNSDCSINVNGTSLAFDGNLTGGQLTKDGTGNLIIGGNASNAGTIANLGQLTLDGTHTGPITVGNPYIPVAFTGTGTNYGTTDLNGPFFPGDTNVAGTITLDGLTLESSSVVYFDLGSDNSIGGGVNDLIQVNGDLTINGNSVVINPTGLLQDGASYRFANYTGTLTMNGGLSVSGPEGYTFTVDTSTPGQINLVPSGGPPIWDGGSTIDSDWSDSANWGGTAIAPNDTLYFAGLNRLVNTNDTPAGTTYGDIDFNVGAGAFTLNGNAVGLGGNINNYSAQVQTINLAMAVAGNTIFNAGTAGLVLGGGITNTSAASYVVHLQGTNGTLAGSLPQGMGVTLDYIAGTSNSWSIAGTSTSYLTNLTVAGDSMTLGNGSDSPSLVVATNGNSYAVQVGATTNTTSTLTINSGTLTANNSSEYALEVGALGSTGILNVNGGTLNLSGAYVQIGDTGGTGIVNQSGGTVNAEVSKYFILGNQTNATGVLNVNGGTFNIPIGAYVGFRGDGTWNISSNGVIVAGIVNMTRNSSDSPNASGTLNLNAGGTLMMDHETMGNAGIGQTGVFNFNGGVLEAVTNSTSFISPAASPSIFTTTVKSGGANINDGGFAVTISSPLIHDATLGDAADGGLVKTGSGTLTLSAANTYNGATTVSNGTLLINGSLGTNIVTVAATLGGAGSIGGPVIIESGGTLEPGSGAAATVTLTINNTAVLNGNVILNLDRTNTQTADELVSPAITGGGALTVTNLGPDLVTGDRFQLFSTAVSGFTSVNLPLHNAANTITYQWQTNLTTDGSITVLSGATSVNTSPTNITTMVAGNQLILNWPADHTGWSLQMQTNSLGQGLGTNWVTIPGSNLSNSYTNTIDPSQGAVFYRMIYQ